MADINVQKKGASVWPWILGLLVAAILFGRGVNGAKAWVWGLQPGEIGNPAEAVVDFAHGLAAVLDDERQGQPTARLAVEVRDVDEEGRVGHLAAGTRGLPRLQPGGVGRHGRRRLALLLRVAELAAGAARRCGAA